MKISYQDLADLLTTGDPREIKRAFAVRMSLLGFSRADVAKACCVSIQFVDKWKANYLTLGVEGLKLAYKGSRGYLSEQEQQEILNWITSHETMSIIKLREYIEHNYNVIYQSETSYIQLLEKAMFSYKRSQKSNPKKNEEQVALKKRTASYDT